MLNSRTERKAIYATGNYFTELGWFFREQPILDFGIDAFVEIGKKGRPTGNFIALQIKGGKSYFHKSKKGITFYFGEIHKEYWLEAGKTFPVLIIIQDPSDDSLYWGRISKETIKKTQKNWKIVIPFTNILMSKSKVVIENILTIHKSSNDYSTDYDYLTKALIEKEVEKPFFTVRNHNKEGLQVFINFNQQSKQISLNYIPSKSDWDNSKQELKWNHPYYFTVTDIEKYISFFIEEEFYAQAINNIEFQIENGGIKKLSEFLFDWNNRNNDVPKYAFFIEAFEHFLKENNEDVKTYELQTVGEVIYFRVDDKEYIMNTYEGKTEELKYLIENKAYEEIYTMTNENIWSEIYLDVGIEKAKFIPEMHNLWERYWDDLYERIRKEVGSTKHLDKSKERSWRQFQIFSESYKEIGDIIKYAYALDDMILYPIAVVAMMNIFNAEVCYEEYCEYEFYTGEWESIYTDNEDKLKPIFHIKVTEM